MQRDPRLKFRFAQGLGDFVACVLHSKWLGWLTRYITGNDKPCLMCSKRAEALNTLFPIRFWRLFYKTEIELLEAISKDLIDAGYDVAISEDGRKIQTSIIEFEPISNGTALFRSNGSPVPEGYTLVSSSDNPQDHLLIRTQIYKRK